MRTEHFLSRQRCRIRSLTYASFTQADHQHLPHGNGVFGLGASDGHNRDVAISGERPRFSSPNLQARFNFMHTEHVRTNNRRDVSDTRNELRRWKLRPASRPVVPSHSSLDHEPHQHRFGHANRIEFTRRQAAEYIHDSADSPAIWRGFPSIESLSFLRTPSPCAGRATNRSAVAAGTTSDNRRQNICRN